MDDPTILRPLDDNATQGLEDSKAIEPSLMPSSSSSASSSPILTRQEVGELGRFSQGKARIQQSLQLLEGRVKPDAFYTLAGVDAAMDREQMMASWVDLDAAVAENDQARADRDRIEDEAQHFDVADMERLRKLAKGECWTSKAVQSSSWSDRIAYLLSFSRFCPSNVTCRYGRGRSRPRDSRPPGEASTSARCS